MIPTIRRPSGRLLETRSPSRWLPTGFSWGIAAVLLLIGGLCAAGLASPDFDHETPSDSLVLLTVWMLSLGTLALGLGTYYLFRLRSITCVLDVETDTLSWVRGGFFDTGRGASFRTVPLSTLDRVHVQRQAARSADHFQLFLVLDDGSRLPLAPSDVDFRDTMRVAEEINAFLGGGRTVDCGDVSDSAS